MLLLSFEHVNVHYKQYELRQRPHKEELEKQKKKSILMDYPLLKLVLSITFTFPFSFFAFLC